MRSIPNKLGGVVAMFLAVLILLLIPYLDRFVGFGAQFYIFFQVFYWLFIVNLGILTWVGGCSVEDPYILVGVLSTIIYFLLVLSLPRLKS